MEPAWEETAFLLVGPSELNAAERLRVQLWDSDRSSADDDLGRIEVDLMEIMKNPRSSAQMWDRSDELRALKPHEGMPGKLNWSVGYFEKTRIQKEQLERQQLEPNVKSMQQLKDVVARDVHRKMREASNRDEAPEIDQQEAQDLRTREGMFDIALIPLTKYSTDNMIAAAPPLQQFPMGVLSLQIHQITGLGLEQINKPRGEDDTADDAATESDDLPSSYCTVILNHQKIFKTRTKPKNSEPYFNAGTERFIRDVSYTLQWSSPG